MQKFNKIFILLAFFGLSVVSTAQVVDSGICGDNLTWELTGSDYNLTLTISGTGDMYDYDDGYNTPWHWRTGSIKSLVIEDGVTSIGGFAFAVCTEVTEVIIPSSVTTISNNSFGACTSLTSVTIPNSVTSIGMQAFMNCPSLLSITIPNSVTSIGEYAFCDCRGLTYVTIPSSITTISMYTFLDCTGLTLVTIPNSVTAIGAWAFGKCTGLREITNLNRYPQNIYEVFDRVDLSLITLTVPACALNDYQNADVWSDFGTIIDDEYLPCEGSAGVETIKANNIKIYPNPTNYELKITNYEGKINNVEICDIAGRIVLIPHSSFLNSINVAHLPKGVYLVKIHTDKGIVTQKVVKN